MSPELALVTAFLCSLVFLVGCVWLTVNYGIKRHSPHPGFVGVFYQCSEKRGSPTGQWVEFRKPRWFNPLLTEVHMVKMSDTFKLDRLCLFVMPGPTSGHDQLFWRGDIQVELEVSCIQRVMRLFPDGVWVRPDTLNTLLTSVIRLTFSRFSDQVRAGDDLPDLNRLNNPSVTENLALALNVALGGHGLRVLSVALMPDDETETSPHGSYTFMSRQTPDEEKNPDLEP